MGWKDDILSEEPNEVSANIFEIHIYSFLNFQTEIILSHKPNFTFNKCLYDLQVDGLQTQNFPEKIPGYNPISGEIMLALLRPVYFVGARTRVEGSLGLTNYQLFFSINKTVLKKEVHHSLFLLLLVGTEVIKYSSLFLAF
jgi:hypothetical protein